MSAEGEKTAVLKVTKVRNKLRDDLSWLQRQNGTPEAEEEKPWMAEVRACRLNSAFADSSPVSSPTKSAPSPTKAEPERSSQPGFMIRGVFTKLDKPASPAPTNSNSGTTQFTKKPSESYKKIAPHTVRSTLENQEGLLSPEEKEKRTEAASSVLKKSAARQRSYVLSAAKKFESPQDENEAPEVKSPPFVAKRVEITEDDEGSKASATPMSPVSPTASAASAPQPTPRKTADDSAKTAVDVTVNEPSAPEQQEEAQEKKEEAVAPLAEKEEESPAESAMEADPFEEMKPGCTKVFTPLPELTPESFQAVIANIEPVESDAPQELVPPLLKLTPATPESLSPTLEPEVPESLALAASVPEPSAPESTKPLVLETSVPSVPEPSAAEPSAPESPVPPTPEPSVAEPSAPESPVPPAPEPSVAEPSAPESPVPPTPEPSVAEPSAPESPVPPAPEPSVAEPSAPESPVPPVPEPSVVESSALESPVPSVPELVEEPSAPEQPAPSIPESVVGPSAPETPIPPVPELVQEPSTQEDPSSSESLVQAVPEPSVGEPSAPESPAQSVPEISVAEPSAPESPVPPIPEPSIAEPSALESPVPPVPEPSVTETSAPESPEPSVAELSAPESPAPSVPELFVAEPSAPVSLAPSIPEPSVPDSPVILTPASTIPESATLVSISPEPQVPESADTTSPVPKSSDLLSLTPESQAPVLSVMDPLAPVSQVPDLLIPVSANAEPPAPVPESPGPDSLAAVSPPPETTAVPVTDLLTPESATLVSSDLQSLVPVSPPQISVVTEAILNTTPEPEPEPESSPNNSSSADTLTALSDTLISFDSGSASVKSSEPMLAEEEGSSTDLRPADHRTELEPVSQLSNCAPVTDDLLALTDRPEASVEPVPPSPGRWSQDLLAAIDGESNPVKVGSALDILAGDVIPINTEARSLNTQPEEEETPAAEGTQSPTETVTITTKTVIITNKGEQDSADPIQTSHVTTIFTESSSADPFDPRPIGTTSPNRASDLLLPLSDASVNSYSTEEKEPSLPETNMSSDALASLADDVIPIDTGAASLSTRRTWARTWDTGTDTDKSQEAEVEAQDGEQKLVVMFERKSKENDSPWDRWTSPTVYNVTSEEEENGSPEDAQQTQTVTTIRETWSKPEPAMDRYASDWRTAVQEEQRVLTPEPEAKKGFVYVKEYVNSTELASHNARDSVPSWSDSTASSTTYSYSSPSTYSSGPLSSVCTYCGELVGNDAKISIEHLNINCHTSCFKCNVCSKPMGDLLDSMFLHRGQVNCESCYAKAFD